MDKIVVENKNRGGFPGWAIILVSMMIVAMGMGNLFSFGVYLKPLQEHFSWNRASVSLASTINWITFGVFSLVFGFMSDRVGTRKVVFSGGMLFGSGLLFASRIEELWQLYIAFGLIAGMGMGSFYVPLASSTARRFEKRRGIAVALVTAGSGVGVLILSPFNRFLIDIVGWRWAYGIMGFAVLGVIIPLTKVLPGRPVEREQTGLIGDNNNALEKVEGFLATRASGYNVNSTLKTSAFWLLTFTHFFCCTAHSGPIFHMVAFATDSGIPRMAAAGILGIMGISSSLGRIGTGHLADKVGPRGTLITVLMLQTLIILLFLFARHMWNFYLFGIVFGISYGGVMPLYPLIAREYFGPRIIGTVYGGVFLASAMGMGLGSYMGGFVFDTMGNYQWLFIIAAMIGSLATLMGYVLKPPGHKPWHERLGKYSPIN